MIISTTEVFISSSLHYLSKEINNWSRSNNIEITAISYTAYYNTSIPRMEYSAIVVYEIRINPQ